jgi:CRP-like cAMP-binding protein
VALQQAMVKYPGISEAIARELVRESDIAAEWVVNVGARTAKERIAHLFCEMAVKSRSDEPHYTQFSFPVTQTMLADATGLSTVHVNRSIQSLRRDELLKFEQGKAQIPNWKALVNVAGFDPGYLQSEKPLRFTH